MTRYTMPARPQGKMHAQRTLARLAEKDVHRWVFAYNMAPSVETLVRKWLVQRLDGFYCNLQLMYNTPLSTSSMAPQTEVDARGLNARDAVKVMIKATGLNPHLSVCGWPFCLDDVDGAHTGGGEV